MPKYTKFYVVEYRIPIEVRDVDSVQEAVSRARKIIQRTYDISPDPWFARIFEYSDDYDNVGPIKEFFYNPNSSTPREIMKNLAYHRELIEKGIDPTKDIPESEMEYDGES
jgi:hypothetical protein